MSTVADTSFAIYARCVEGLEKILKMATAQNFMTQIQGGAYQPFKVAADYDFKSGAFSKTTAKDFYEECIFYVSTISGGAGDYPEIMHGTGGSGLQVFVDITELSNQGQGNIKKGSIISGVVQGFVTVRSLNDNKEHAAIL